MAPAEEAGGAGDNHDGVKRHRWAGVVSVVGPGVLILSFLLALGIWQAMATTHPEAPFIQRYFSWMPAGDLQIDAALQLDQLSMVMVLVVTGVGALIHIFSVGYMRDDPGYPRYFSYLNLFVFFMLMLVLGANYPVLFVGWEGVGLCSYLLIGFWFNDKVNADAGKKAFILNRIGDFGFLVAMFMLFANIGVLDFIGVSAKAGDLVAGSPLITAICLFMFLGCTGKSAQIPLYVWLPDAMAGPTPVSALIHAATMVTAGVYLIARSSFLFSLSPVASLTVAVVGAVTAIFAATIGLKQWDIKKVLAYSTISQLGYMFVGVGVGAYVSGMFHLVTHSFFKALLFLGSGSVIHAMHAAYHQTHSADDAQDMRNMGGLRRYLPITFVLMWIATLAISGIPLLSGFFSKDEILASVFARAHGSTLASASWLGIPGGTLLYVIYGIGLAAAFLTAIYMTRLMLYTFHGPVRTGTQEEQYLHEPPWIMTSTLVILGILTVFGGWLNLPEVITDVLPLGPRELLTHWLDPVVGPATARITAGTAQVPAATEQALIGAAVVIAVTGIVFAMARLKSDRVPRKRDAVPEEGFERVVANKYYVDEALDRTVVIPTYAMSRNFLWRFVDNGLIDGLFVNGSAALARGFGWVGSRLQTGNVGIYAWVLVVGVLAMLGAFTLR
ncbi:MAG: NADH-quinone oxidoreductase subunit L [Gemmatimonadetes bacterium 13_1_40CM_2_60_3]|nr:MAG: NADH-quinone oxidoreductase subunit L [Gemmatimonadetes bacterium 13_1_40CM_2_60_3]